MSVNNQFDGRGLHFSDARDESFILGAKFGDIAATSKIQQRKFDYKQNLRKLIKPEIPMMTPEYVNRRIELNKMRIFDKCTHPQQDKVKEFKLKDDHCIIKSYIGNGSIVFVKGERTMKFMCAHLSMQKEIAIDSEFDSMHFYKECIALIQISSYEYDFIIDPFLVFKFLKPMLEPIFMNEAILKVFFSNSDIPRFQRDFELFFVGIVDVQAIRKEKLGLNQVESLSTVVRDLIGIDLDKTYQNFYWITRPLPKKALEYARQDSRMLLKCWNKIKTQQNVKELSLKSSNAICSTVYTFPRDKHTPISDYNYLVTLWKDSKIEGKFDIYEKIWQWKNEIAQQYNRNAKDLITSTQLTRLLQFETFEFNTIKNVLGKIKEEDISNLCRILNEKEEEMNWQENQSNFEVVQILEGDLNCTVPEGGTVEFMEIDEEDTGNTSGAPEDDKIIHEAFQNLSVKNNPDPIDIKELRKMKRKESKKAWKIKFRLENEDRIKKGLPPLKRPYGRGKAWKLRGARRKRMGLPVGPTTFTKRA